MSNEYVKKLTGKNPKDFEFAAAHIVNSCDLEAFSALVDKGDFLFDFIKENVNKRLSKAVNSKNYRNLLTFLKVYSPDYEDFIVSSLVKYADEDLTDEMLEILENGSLEEKTYCAKYFSHINDSLSIEFLREYSYSDFDALSMNCAQALSKMGDDYSYKLALEKLKSEDDFEKLSAVRFLIAFNDIAAVDVIFDTMRKSSIPENIAAEISYLQSFLDFLDTDFKYDTILAINHILCGLGEIISLSQVFDFQLFEVLEKLVNVQEYEKNSKIALVLLNSRSKFDQLTETDEYLFDEDKKTKDEIHLIRDFLNSLSPDFWSEQKNLFVNELNQSSDFVFSALELVQELGFDDTIDKLKELLNLTNQTLILKTVEVIKSLGRLNELDKNFVLQKISDKNIKAVIDALFE